MDSIDGVVVITKEDVYINVTQCGELFILYWVEHPIILHFSMWCANVLLAGISLLPEGVQNYVLPFSIAHLLLGRFL